VLSLTQVRALAELRMDERANSLQARERLTYLILCSVSGVAAGLQNTG
jgi:phosphoenolpyruvate carboxylase